MISMIRGGTFVTMKFDAFGNRLSFVLAANQ
jgi:hypothetical protein